MICVALKGETAEEMVARATAAISAGARMVEFRIDSLKSPSAESLQKLSAVNAVKIATFKGRSMKLAEGPDAASSLRSFDYIDIGLEDANTIQIPSSLRSKLIVSYHGSITSHDELKSVVRKELQAGAIAKCIGTRGSFAEASLLLNAADSNERNRVIAFSTGGAGLLTRLASLKNGAPWTYASLSDDERTADGQPVFSDLQEMQNGHVNVLIGADVSRSPSPVLQNYALAKNGLRGRYAAMSIGSRKELAPFFECARAAGVRGVNITMPYKRDAVELMSDMDIQAGRIGAINTVVIDGDRMSGYNTDYTAVSQLISGMPRGRALLVGSGGAARSAAAALHEFDMTIISRNSAGDGAIASSLGFENSRFEPGGSYDVVINCTPIGMDGTEGSLPEGVASCTFHTVIDFVYSKRKTPYRLLAEKQSCRFIGGADILARQAAASFKLWTGMDAPLDGMLSILRKEGYN